MPLRIFLTSDVHLGMKFAAYPEVQAELTEARFTTLTRMVDRANDEKCDLFVVAGDLFDKPRVAKRDILKTAGIVNGFEGHLSVILPGNHDFLSSGETEPWMTFREGAGDAVLLLEKQEVYSLKHYDLDVNLYPAPCRMKHSRENLLGWISQAAGHRYYLPHRNRPREPGRILTRFRPAILPHDSAGTPSVRSRSLADGTYPHTVSGGKGRFR